MDEMPGSYIYFGNCQQLEGNTTSQLFRTSRYDPSLLWGLL